MYNNDHKIDSDQLIEHTFVIEKQQDKMVTLLNFQYDTLID